MRPWGGQQPAFRVSSPSFTWEIVIIDDGSKDNTAGLVQVRMSEGCCLGGGVSGLPLAPWCAGEVRKCAWHGEGAPPPPRRQQREGRRRAQGHGAWRRVSPRAAPRVGPRPVSPLLSCLQVRGRGQYLIMVDADGATKASDLGRLLDELRRVERGGLGIAIGSRAHLSDPAAAGGVSRTPLRRFLMWGFHTFIQLMIGGGGTASECEAVFPHVTARASFPAPPCRLSQGHTVRLQDVHAGLRGAPLPRPGEAAAAAGWVGAQSGRHHPPSPPHAPTAAHRPLGL